MERRETSIDNEAKQMELDDISTEFYSGLRIYVEQLSELRSVHFSSENLFTSPRNTDQTSITAWS